MKRALSIWVAFLLLLSLGQVASASGGRMGWCLVNTEYLQNDLDVDVNGGPYRNVYFNGQYDLVYIQDTVSGHSVVIDISMKNLAGDLLTHQAWQVEWEEPAAFLPAGEHASVTVAHTVLEDPAGCDHATVKIDVPGLWATGTSSSPNIFRHPNGEFDGTVDWGAVVFNDRQVMTSRDPLPEGDESYQIALYVYLGASYCMRYTYAWGPEPARPAGTATPAPFSVSPFGADKDAKSEVLWTNVNTSAAEGGAKAYYVFFDLERDAVVTSIRTYHSPGGKPGELMLYAESGSQWGPFKVTAAQGQGGVKIACWIADTRELELPAGRYAVADSDPDTWSRNAESGYEGFLEVRGYVPGAAAGGNPFVSATTAPDIRTVSPEGKLIGLWLSEPVEEGNQVMLDIWPGGSLELFYCRYAGSGEGNTQAILNAQWERLASAPCSYRLSADTMYLDNGHEVNELAVQFPDNDTLHLTDAHGYRMVLHRASSVQEDAWRSWAWGTINPQDTGGGESHDGGNAVPPQDDQLGGWLTGLWLSEADADGNQTLVHALPGGRIELYPCSHYGGDGTLDYLTDGNWDFIGPEVFRYDVTRDVLTLYYENGSALIWAMNILNGDTILMEDEFANALLYKRATSRQEADWLEWMKSYRF